MLSTPPASITTAMITPASTAVAAPIRMIMPFLWLVSAGAGCIAISAPGAIDGSAPGANALAGAFGSSMRATVAVLPIRTTAPVRASDGLDCVRRPAVARASGFFAAGLMRSASLTTRLTSPIDSPSSSSSSSDSSVIGAFASFGAGTGVATAFTEPESLPSARTNASFCFACDATGSAGVCASAPNAGASICVA